MKNWDTAEAGRYHERTKHSFESVRGSGHYLDWANRPKPFKEYPGVEPLPLPDELPKRNVPALDVLAGTPEPTTALPGLPDLARLLRWGAGVVRTRTHPCGETYHFRTYSSAGGLYPLELYVASAELPGLGPGLYHFHPLELALRPLRDEDVRTPIAAAADDPVLANAAVILLITGILWRSGWKYQARAYRHLYWDSGTMLANLLALATSAGLGPRLVTGFVDTEINYVLGVDGEREAALALLAFGKAERAKAGARLESLDLESPPLSHRAAFYPEAVALHDASSLETTEEVLRYRVGRERDEAAVALHGQELSPDPLETVIRRRGSARDFTLDAIPASELRAILARAAAPIPADFPPSNEIYLVANAVDGLEPGAYRFQPPECFEPLRRGDFRREAGFLCLEQALGARAAATLFFLVDLERVLQALGNRGYRAAQLEAGIRAGKIYLGAYAQGLGATGLTFYDDEVTDFFAPGTGETPMLCVAVGIDARRPELRLLRSSPRR